MKEVRDLSENILVILTWETCKRKYEGMSKINVLNEEGIKRNLNNRENVGALKVFKYREIITNQKA